MAGRVAAAALAAAGPAWAAAEAASGGPTPRYVTLNAAPVNARVGPGEGYRALWRFTARGVPLQVVDENGGWRRVCDPEGGLGWVRAEALDARRTVMRVKGGDLVLRARPAEDGRPVAWLAARAVADLIDSRGSWRRITVDHATGWVRAGEVWGGVDTPQCGGR